ncbi:MAG: aminotransferase DegT, partial [Candidatus Rokubacteria bacterium]|nr:aminotransferase DegT [Candidatus Rokubacteria bacterium]
MTEPSRRVKYVDLPRQFADGEVVRRVAEEFSRCRFVLGPQV